MDTPVALPAVSMQWSSRADSLSMRNRFNDRHSDNGTIRIKEVRTWRARMRQRNEAGDGTIIESRKHRHLSGQPACRSDAIAYGRPVRITMGEKTEGSNGDLVYALGVGGLSHWLRCRNPA